MKKFFTLFFFVVCFFNSHAQPYNKFLDNDSWYMQLCGFSGCSYYWYYKSNDTLISGVTYTIIRYSDNSGQYYIREDSINKKVYKNNKVDPEYLLYDFSLSPGGLFAYQGTTYQLDSISQVTTLLGIRNKFHFHPVGNPFAYHSYLEGIGSQADPLEFMHGTDPVWTLVCSYIDVDQAYYAKGMLVTCPANIFTGYSSFEKQNLIFELYPNPSTNNLTLQLSETPKAKITFQIYDVTGREVSAQSQILNLQSQIDVSSLQAGVYFLRIVGGENAVVKRFLKE